ncbi:integrin beta-1-A isoform X2 [Nematostella vectensis]|uniref:integrin beta-1-A isoform X2 n=1 Tax=Nematostella vectensis TaxID=45351 RepID=UPI0020778D57|nr:integrin beta-1-A isoform X2 [Nematostella vectensis]
MLQVLVLSILFAFVSAQSSLSEECKKKLTCGECIQTSPECGWCEDLNYFWGGQPSPRCNDLQSHREKFCKRVANPKSSFDTSTDSPLDDRVKVSPQNMTLNLRPGQPTTFKVKVRMPENYPVDLYYLMDLSGSMLEDIAQVKTLGQKIADEMANITTRFRLGFGAFVDKPLAPYIDTYPPVRAHPDLTNPSSVPAFGFKNMLSLNKDPKKFESTVASLNISGNVDSPEGGLDALMQVAVCEKEIGWANKLEARRLVIFTTDSGYHFAGDGLLGGVVTPNDAKCHLEGNTYAASTTLDYPSVGSLRETLLQYQVAPIFAITKTQVDIYKTLVSFFGKETGAVAERLNSDSSNVVPLIREAYLKIAQTQTVTDTAPDGIKVDYTANCLDGRRVGENTCTGVKIGEEVSFDVSVTATDCSKKVPGFSLKTAFGDIDISLKYICDCQCEKPENSIEGSIHCSTNGTLSCGVCDCDRGSAGRLCNCPAGSQYEPKRCARGGNSTAQVCSGRGVCDCGECICTESKTKGEIIYGKYCECTNMDCPRDPGSGLPCGGPEHGICDCGTCNCTGNWTGPDCMCTKSNETCIRNGVLCSGRGTCECGQCVCNATSGYVGAFCDDCPTCPGQCEANRDCVQCMKFGTGKLAGAECAPKCGGILFEMVDEIKPEMGEKCLFEDQDDCFFTFAYRENENQELVIYVQKERDCPEEAEALAVILGVVGGVLGVGLALLLIWKLLATIQDRREFAKFEKERQNAKWDTGENPIFKQATTTFQNPTYGGK